MSELQQYLSLHKQIESHEYDWMCKLWKWADAHMLNHSELPRDRKKLLNLKSFKLTSETDEEATTPDELRARADKTAARLIIIMQFETAKHMSDISQFISNITYLPKEIGNLHNLEELCIQWSAMKSLPDEITSLEKLKKLCLCFNPYLTLTEDQKNWVRDLEANGAEVYYAESLLHDKV